MPNKSPTEAMHALSWNVGGLQAKSALEMILALRKGGIQPFTGPLLVVLLQEITCDPGKFHDALEDLRIVFGKGPEDWRGNAVVHSSDFAHTRGKILPCAVSCVLTSECLRIGAFSVHVPHHATLSVTEQLLQQLDPYIVIFNKGVLGVDANESFSKAAQNKQIKAHTARGERLVECFEAHGMYLPEQALQKPSYFPYNKQMTPRRLDYVLVRKLLCNAGDVLQHRDVATSDHEPVCIPLTQLLPRGDFHRSPPVWSSRCLRPPGFVERTLDAEASKTPTGPPSRPLGPPHPPLTPLQRWTQNQEPGAHPAHLDGATRHTTGACHFLGRLHDPCCGPQHLSTIPSTTTTTRRTLHSTTTTIAPCEGTSPPRHNPNQPSRNHRQGSNQIHSLECAMAA